MQDVNTLDLARIAQDLQIRKVQVESVVHLLEEGNTVPFITRYRKERTGGLNEEVIRHIQTRVANLRQLLERKQTILRSIDSLVSCKIIYLNRMHWHPMQNILFTQITPVHLCNRFFFRQLFFAVWLRRKGYVSFLDCGCTGNPWLLR